MKKIITLLLLVLIYKVSFAQSPVYSITSPQNFIITCGNPTVTIYITSTTAPAYTFTVVTPGTYTFMVVSGTVTTHIPLSIISDTIAPNISVSSTASVLSCAISSIQLQGSSTTASVGYLWAGNQGTMAATASVNINANYTIMPGTAPFGTYSLTVTNPVNQCTSNSVVTIYQDIFPPNAGIVSSFTALTCSIYSIVLNNNSSSGIPTNSIFPNNQSVTALNWVVPSPDTESSGNSIVAFTPGHYTLTVKDLNNGCISSTTILIGDNRVYPVISTAAVSTISCPGGTASLNASVIGSNNNFIYIWSNGTGTISGATSISSLTVNAAGYYNVIVTDTLNGCASQAQISVYACVGFEEYDDPFAALNVFPNPVSDKLHFNFDRILPTDSKLIIRNSLGQTVFSKDNTDLKDELDLNFLKSGIYYLTLEYRKYLKGFRILKE